MTGGLRIAGVGVVTAGLVAYGLQSAAQAAPEKVLQSVDVTLGTDGAVSSISSTAIRSDGESDPSDDEKTHDPSKVAGDLPIRVLTSYRLGKKTGTDLDDLKGAKGRVHIEVTVQNTTVRPTLLSYDSEAQSKTSPALVGTPLTVVASADLGDTPLSQIVPASNDGETAGTNGVVSRGSGGDAQVQWATMLAPPRLATSATFTLVQDVDDFDPPSFDISVQPGLVTDTSVSRLIDSVFTDDNGTQKLTSRTIALLGSVGTVLTDATTVLAKVEEQLDGSASDLGSKTISDLQSSSSYVTSALSGLSGDLDSLETSMDSQLKTSRDKAVQQLANSFKQVKDKVLGDPDQIVPVLPAPTATGCVVPTLTEKDSSTVLGQLRVIEAQLNQLSGATAGCKDEIAVGLKATIGTLEDTCQAPRPGSTPTALGSLTCASDAIGTATEDLTAVQADVNATFDEQLLVDARTALDNVLLGTPGRNGIPSREGGLAEIRSRASELNSGAVGDDLEELKDDLEDVQTELEGVKLDLGTINQRAGDQIESLTAALADTDRLADLVCAQITDPTALTEAIELLQGAGSTCDTDSTDEETTSLTGKINASIEAAQEIQARSAVTTTGPDTPALGGIVEGLLDTVGGLLQTLNAITSGAGGNFATRVQTLVDTIEQLYQPIPVDPIDDVPQPDKPALITQLTTAFDDFEKNQQDVSSVLSDAFTDAGESLTDTDSKIAGSKTVVDAARQKAETGSSGLFTEFSKSLASVGSSIVQDGAQAVRQQRAQLDAEASTFARGLDGTVAKSIRAIGSQVNAANRDLSSSEKELTGDLQAILVNIGKPQQNGSGLLGAIYTGARRTGASNGELVDAAKLADAFSQVRGASLDDLYLQQAQVTASLEKEAAFPVFDITVPAGSTTRTVFSFHIGQD
ncbi:molybdopterin converting factor small subunit [Aeromicrobium fastidiosum]|nr:molybdopterin converting factor small subunit [Aeromicrobium fastidiosum]